MTEERLREALHERVEDLTTRDLAGSAWGDGLRTRRRRRAVLTMAAASLCVVVLVGGGALTRPGPAPLAGAGAGSGERYRFSYAESPTPAGEADLPLLTTPLPPVLDVGAPASSLPPRLANAAVALVGDSGLRRVRVWDVLTGWHDVDVSRLAPVPGPDGTLVPPASDTMLAPDGSTLLFPQAGHLELYDVERGSWREVEVEGHDPLRAHWAGATIVVPLPGELGDAGALYLTSADHDRGTAGASVAPTGGTLGYGVPVAADVRTGSGAVAQTMRGGLDPDRVEVREGRATSYLTLAESVADPRAPQCCQVVGWTDDSTVAYLSRGVTPRVVGWRVGTDELGLVTTIAGTEDWADWRLSLGDLRCPLALGGGEC